MQNLGENICRTTCGLGDNFKLREEIYHKWKKLRNLREKQYIVKARFIEK